MLYMTRYTKEYYRKKKYKGTSLLCWAIRWFMLDNLTFYMMFGFSFNPHEYPNLYEIAKKEVYGVCG